ncbi:ABC transporter substrate-binding protein [uncultured Cohaesibacter sp.]|uniref:ABC transporter substrate-binding protein n=1 Tax=uncultured Cohaesibacter sp. TaxID=1002546 RepID=UPI0029317AEE|nr:ABC transporter substrate-binding protein [uncultured Cohaesibacter sp.]
MTRKSLLLSVALAGSMIASGAFASGQCTAYNESPILKDAVASGALPAVADRLPSEPLVIKAKEIGTYGGTLRDVYSGGRLADYRAYGYDPLVRWSVDGSEVVPNVAKSWEISEDATTYTFHLREGMKWSDGEPFTAKDILFWWEHVETNSKVLKKPRKIFFVDGEAAKVEALDDYTIRFSWSKPNGNFLLDMASPYGQRVVQFPAHYVAQFDIDLNPEGVKKMMAEAGEDNYMNWWTNRVGSYGKLAEQNDPKRPTILAWKTDAPFIGKQHFVLSRNPYYFKVDADCNQLPYIDNRDFTEMKEPEVLLLKTMAGEFDISERSISTSTNKGVFFENKEKGKYHFVDAKSCNYNNMFIELPFNHPDQKIADFFSNKDVRIALSIGIDRQGMIDTVYLGQGEPYQAAPRPNSPYYNEQLARQYTEYDPDKANEILDKIYPNKDADGFRLFEDGSRVSIRLDAGEFRPEWSDLLEILTQNWADLGIELHAAIAGDAYEVRRRERDRQMLVWVGENGCGLFPAISLTRLLRYQSNWDNWMNWVTKINPQSEVVEADAKEPPEAVKRLYELTAIIPTKAGDDRTKLMGEFMQTMADEFLNIGTVLPEGNYRVVSDRLGNVPDTLIEGWLYPGPAPANYSAFYIKK